MKERITGWISLLLLLASSGVGLPVTRGAAAPALQICAQIVCEHRDERGEQVAPPRAVPPAVLLAPASPRESAIAVLLDYSLFQRPPPAA